MVGESEANMRKTFDEKNAPAVIFIDEIDLIYQSSKKPNAEEISVSQVSSFEKIFSYFLWKSPKVTKSVKLKIIKYFQFSAVNARWDEATKRSCGRDGRQ